MQLAGTSVVVTGGSRGLGPQIARALLARGARVTLAARSAEGLEAVHRALGTERVATVAADVTKVADRARIVAAAEEAFGPVDVLVNNAGVEYIRRFTDYGRAQVRETIAVNLEAAILLSLLVVPGMVERGRGHLVNMASVAGKAAVPYNTVYAATKHGLLGFTYSLRAELHGTGVSVSAVCPGFVTDVGFAEHWITGIPRTAGTGTTSAKVARAVVRAVEQDLPEVVVSGFLPKLSDVALAISPRLTEAAARRTGAYGQLRAEAEAQARQG